MNSLTPILCKSVNDIKFQPGSTDIWEKKYQLKDANSAAVDLTIEDTYKRCAKALAETEKTPEDRAKWEERFYWAMQNGALPAGRILSNAGAMAYKPATSTINCTVSGTIEDAMTGIMTALSESAITLKAGCGIGYEFSTLRPKGSFVRGAGAQTSGPLSFMDIFDKMCFTISSAGGRRGAQMGTFDVQHPDIEEFIKAKREGGRLRQFNLSVLITDAFVEAVKNKQDWPLVFPITVDELALKGIELNDRSKIYWREWALKDERYITNDEGLTACLIYKTIPAQRLWNVIMSSTYDFAEPGFILIDRYNEMNNNWYCENIRATNPCGLSTVKNVKYRWVCAVKYGIAATQIIKNVKLEIVNYFGHFSSNLVIA